MEYVAPPRGAMALLNFFAGEPDFAHVLGDLSEEFQQRASAHGEAAARGWYWREAFRNAMALGKREFQRTPGRALAVSLAAGVTVQLVIAVLMGPLMQNIQWAWIPTRFWTWYRTVWIDVAILISTLLYVVTGATGSLLMRSREFALALSFAIWSTVYAVWVLSVLGYSSARGRLPAGVSLSLLDERVVLGWVWTIILYSAGCFWIRWRRLAHLKPGQERR